MFKKLPDTSTVSGLGKSVTITIDGQAVTCNEQDLLATVLLSTDRLACRDTVVSGKARGPFCMMGVCYDCLVEIDGLPNRQACLTRVSAGMRVMRQHGARGV